MSRLRLPCMDLRVAGDEAHDSFPESAPITPDRNGQAPIALAPAASQARWPMGCAG